MTLSAGRGSMLPSGFHGRAAEPRDASGTSIVAPIAHDQPSTNDATMPDSAAGTTTLSATSKRVAPSAYAASRIERGTADIASSLIDEIIGMIMLPTTIPALSAL